MSGQVTSLELTGPNERREAMTGLTVMLPDGLRIVRAHPSARWTASADDSTATWRGGPAEYWAVDTFVLDLDVTASPGQLTFDTVQHYPGGETVTWPVTLTVVPGPEDEPSQNLGWALAAGVAGLAVVTGLGVLAWRRRTAALPER
jgi:hypothetical protein